MFCVVRIIFCISLAASLTYIATAFLTEFVIEKIDTGFPRFITCVNSKCNSVFPLSSSKELSEAKLCPTCLAESQIKHVIQCKNCESVLGLYEVQEFESANVFYVEKCPTCQNGFDEELKIQPFLFPHLMM